MKILLCQPFEPDAPKGNSIASDRLSRGFRERGHSISIIGHPLVDDPAGVEARVSAFQPDVCLVMHAWRCARAMEALARKPSVPIVVSLRGTDLNEMLDAPATSAGIARALDQSSGIVVFHGQGRGKLADKNPARGRKTCIIPNGVRLPSSDVDYRRRLGISPGTFVFLSVCGLREVKQPLRVLPWLSELIAGIPPGELPRPVVFAHAGPPLEAEVARAFDEFAAVHPWVYHLDRVPHEEIDSFLRAGDVFIAASRSEGMPHAVREALLAGLPALLSNIEGHLAMAEPDREALFFGDREEFLRKAERLFQDPALRERLGTAGRRRVEADLKNGDEITAYLSLFTELVQRKTRR